MWVPKAGVSLELSCRHYKVTAEQKDLCEEEISSSSATEEEIKRNCTVYLHELIQTSMKPAPAMENRAHLLFLPDKGQLAERGKEDSGNCWGRGKAWTFQLSRLDGNCPVGALTPTVTVPEAFSGHRLCCPCCWFCCLFGVSEAGRRSTW